MPSRKPLLRNLESKSITKFRGINRFTNLAAMSPDYAVDLLNVILGASGGMKKARMPRAKSSTVLNGTCYGAFDFQQASGVRQIIVSINTKLYKFEWDGTEFVPTQIDDNPDNAHRWSAVVSDGLLLMANGHRMIKWTGTTVYRWGIGVPPTAPFVDTTKTRPVTESQLVSNIATYTTDDTSELVIGDSVTLAALTNPAYNTAGQIVVAIIDGTHFSTALVHADIAFLGGQAGTYTVVGPLTLVTGRKYAASFKASITSHQSTITPVSVSSGPVATGIITVSIDDADTLAYLAADPQIDTVVWYATIDGGVEYLFHSEALIGLGIPLLNDRKLDADLSTLERGPLVNDPPPVGFYVHEWGGRIYIGNLDGTPQDIVYSGVEQIRVGRPDESFPPFNRLRLAIGADDIRGLGVVQAGLVAGSKSNEIFMFRGEVEDVVSSELVAYSAVLEKLPFATAFGSHYSICSTPNGLQGYSSARSIDVYNGTSKPSSVSLAISDVMKRITEANEQDTTAIFYNNVDKDWYIAAFAVDGSAQFNYLVVFDMDDEPNNSAGITLFQFGSFDMLFKCEDPSGSGRTMVMVVQDGLLKEFSVLADEINDITQTLDENDDDTVLLDAYWQPGAFGNESSNVNKHFRHVHVVSDQPVGLSIKLYDDVEHDFDHPKTWIKSPEQWDGNKFGVNYKGNRISPGIVFPTTDANCAVQELRITYIPVGDR